MIKAALQPENRVDRAWEITLKALVPASIAFSAWMVSAHFQLDKRISLVEHARAAEQRLLQKSFDEVNKRLDRIEQRLDNRKP